MSFIWDLSGSRCAVLLRANWDSTLHNFKYQIVALNEALLTNSMSLSQESEDELLAVSSIFFDISVLEPPKSILVTPNNDIQVRFILSNDYPEK